MNKKKKREKKIPTLEEREKKHSGEERYIRRRRTTRWSLSFSFLSSSLYDFCLKVEGFDLELYEPCSNRFPARFLSLSLFSSFVCRVSFHSRTELFKPYAKLGCRERERIMDVIIALTSVEEKKKRGKRNIKMREKR